MTDISRRQFFFVGTAATFAALGLSACSDGGKGSVAVNVTYKDGAYTGRSSNTQVGAEGDGYGIITVTVENGHITEATFEAFQLDGTPKDKEYGKDGLSYNAAQVAVSAGNDYAKKLVEVGSPDGVDAISGATFMYKQFKEAAEDALSQAQ